jgi:hypothetical protein
MINTNPVNMFLDLNLDKKMVTDGYLVLPFLAEEEITFFKELYKKWHPTDPDAFYKSYFDPRLEYKRDVENAIIKIFNTKMKAVFTNYDSFGGLFVVKPPTEKGHLPPHQDWPFVDEKKHWSINMWCPLEDVSDANGNIVVLKGSHQFNETIRGVGSTPDIYRDHWKIIEENMLSVPMKAGEAIFFFHGLLHGSTHNTTENTRVSIGLTLTPKNTDLFFHYLDKIKEKEQLEKFQTTPDFYIKYATERGVKPKMDSVPHSF